MFYVALHANYIVSCFCFPSPASRNQENARKEHTCMLMIIHVCSCPWTLTFKDRGQSRDKLFLLRSRMRCESQEILVSWPHWDHWLSLWVCDHEMGSLVFQGFCDVAQETFLRLDPAPFSIVPEMSHSSYFWLEFCWNMF